MDALKLCQRLKELEKTKNIQIMVVTDASDLENTVKMMEFGADDFISKPIEKNALKTRIEILLNKKKAADTFIPTPQTANNGALYDKVSGLYTRDYFDQQLNLEIKRSMRQRYPLTLMIIHIDVLAMDDGSLGDLTRDQLINQYGQIIKKCIRDEDFAAYYGDRVFAALLPFLDKHNAASIVRRFETAVNEHDIFSQGSTSDKHVATASLGFACCPSDACTAERLVQRAVTSLRRAQKSKQG
jgi:two-component system cell cycle response regulator